MREAKEDLWRIDAEARCVTTNGSVRTDGRAVMGRGCALQARRMFPGVDVALGSALGENGNRVQVILRVPLTLVAFPVKHRWFERADPGLIARSARQLAEVANKERWSRAALPRPGCGNGRLRWEAVGPLLEPILDDRFVIASLPERPNALE